MNQSKCIKKLDWKFNIMPALRELNAQPELWDQIDLRTNFPESPHRESHDIWLRCAANFNEFRNPHISVWYEPAAMLPSMVALCQQMMKLTNGKNLGGVLVTRIPPGKQIYPHVDEGWHARYYEKFAIQLASSPGQAFCFEDGQLNVGPGESFWFDNAFKHWVINPSKMERITLITCIRRA